MVLAIRARRFRPEAAALCWKARQDLIDQTSDWAGRPFVERQRMLLDFRTRAGRSVDEWLEILGRLERELVAGPGASVTPVPLDRLAAFYDHLGDDDAIGYARRSYDRRDDDRRAADVRRLADLLEPVDALTAR